MEAGRVSEGKSRCAVYPPYIHSEFNPFRTYEGAEPALDTTHHSGLGRRRAARRERQTRSTLQTLPGEVSQVQSFVPGEQSHVRAEDILSAPRLRHRRGGQL